MEADRVTKICWMVNRRGYLGREGCVCLSGSQCFDMIKELKAEGVKLKTMYVPAWKRTIILAAWIGGELVYDRRADG